MQDHLIWPAVRIAVAVAIVVVPFGYAITGVHTDVLLGAGCGLAVGVGVGLRGTPDSGLWTGILIGSIVGMASALIAGLLPGNPWGYLVPPVLALSVGLIRVRGARLSGYSEMSRETFIASILLSIGLLPALIAMGNFSHPDGMNLNRALLPVLPVGFAPLMALIAGLLTHRHDGWRDTRPPALLLLGAAVPVALLVFMLATGRLDSGSRMWQIALAVLLSMFVVPAAAFLVGRLAITWLEPRLRVYGHLIDYLRVMWVPIGGFAVGYLTIIVLFAGFYGMLERFSPGAFADAGTGIIDWVSFAFFTALGQDYATVAPVSVGARALVGAHLILSAGWAVVLFAAVMSSIGPKLARIARHHSEDDAD
ncbi:MAG: hypothetical protein F4Z31_18450 [Gemmatimonadetes bacterium]|nr:hypothetical protein [Gemmatimonadota bacterium]MYA43711.1 hypothetical protein [Gemmatimonadota bacterium]MYE94146.1 hypothetical protein [Gemmatimonadota bacterium]MYJ09676.1 hypothetical protein [Gemmatimonadota bacterium]